MTAEVGATDGDERFDPTEGWRSWSYAVSDDDRERLRLRYGSEGEAVRAADAIRRARFLREYIDRAEDLLLLGPRLAGDVPGLFDPAVMDELIAMVAIVGRHEKQRAAAARERIMELIDRIVSDDARRYEPPFEMPKNAIPWLIENLAATFPDEAARLAEHPDELDHAIRSWALGMRGRGKEARWASIGKLFGAIQIATGRKSLESDWAAVKRRARAKAPRSK